MAWHYSVLQSVLDCLSYLHGAGLAYKHSLGGRATGVISIRSAFSNSLWNGSTFFTAADLKAEFPALEEQIQLKDLIENDNDSMRLHLKKHLRYVSQLSSSITVRSIWLSTVIGTMYHVHRCSSTRLPCFVVFFCAGQEPQYRPTSRGNPHKTIIKIWRTSGWTTVYAVYKWDPVWSLK